jgi:hypothetical protein
MNQKELDQADYIYKYGGDAPPAELEFDLIIGKDDYFYILEYDPLAIGKHDAWTIYRVEGMTYFYTDRRERFRTL